MPFGIDKLRKKIEELENATGNLEQSVSSMTSEMSNFKQETSNLSDQMKNLTASIDNLSNVFNTQVKGLNESLMTLGKNLTQNVVENILSLPKLVPDFWKKKRDSKNSTSK